MLTFANLGRRCHPRVEEQLQALNENNRARSADAVHDLLLRLGDLSRRTLAPCWLN